MLAAIMAELEIYVTHILIAEIHEGAFKATTTLHFPCLIFQLYRDASVPFWHCEPLLDATKTLDISLIRDDANLIVLQRELQGELPPLGYDLATDIE